MLERGPAPRNAEPDEEPGEPARHRHHEVAGARAEEPEREQAALAEPLREHPGGKLEEPHRAAVGGADQPHLGEAEAEGLGEDREQDVDRGGEPVLDPVRRAARRQRHLPPGAFVRLAHISSAVPNPGRHRIILQDSNFAGRLEMGSDPGGTRWALPTLT